MNTTLADLLENPEKTMTSIIQRVATGPQMSKSISYDEARAGMRLVLEELADPIQSAVFLIGLRVKRETDDENNTSDSETDDDEEDRVFSCPWCLRYYETKEEVSIHIPDCDQK